MALDFAGTTHKVVIAPSSSLDDISAGSILMWVWLDNDPCTLGASAKERLWVKKDSANVGLVKEFSPFCLDSTNRIILQVRRATTNLTVLALWSNFTPGLAASKWVCLAGTWDSSGSDTSQTLYGGDLSTAISEPSSYPVQRVGSGALDSDAGGDTALGQSNVDDQNLDGKIALMMLWNTPQTLGQLRAQQWRPHKTANCVQFTRLGSNGTGTQPDWSGNGNSGTVTGATVAAHVPLGLPFRMDLGAALFAPVAISNRAGLAPIPMLVWQPVPDGTIGATDRQAAAWMYDGIAAAAPAAAGPRPGSLLTLGVGR